MASTDKLFVCPVCGSPLERRYSKTQFADVDPATGKVGTKYTVESFWSLFCSNASCDREIYADEEKEMRRRLRSGGVHGD